MLSTRTSASIPTPEATRRSLALRARRDRRRRQTPTLVAGIALGLTAIVGVSSATAAAALDPELAEAVAASAPSAPYAQTRALNGITDEARTTLEAARAAKAGARSVATQVEASGLDLEGPTAIDVSELDKQIDRLAAVDVVPLMLVPDLTDDALVEVKEVSELTRDLRERLDAAEAERAAAQAAAEAAAEAAAKKEREAEAAAAALAAANTVEGAKATAASVAASDYGWGGDQFACLDSLWTKESGWNYQAYNASSGATGIPQALPGSKMATVGDDWQSNATTQIRWGLQYIAAAYGTPCSAWGHSQATDWY